MSSNHPDADIHPVATGAAAKIVEAHSQEEPLILYSGWFCPFVQRSWITLEEKKIPYQYVEINPYRKEPSFLKLNPRGLVPTLGCPDQNEQDGSTNGDSKNITRKPLIESNIICDYLEETYSNTKKLYPSSTYEKARSKIWMDFASSRIVQSYHRFLQHTANSGYSLDSARQEFLGHLKTWIKEADPDGPFFGGKDFGMADIVLAPWAVRMWVFDHFKDGGLGIPQRGEGRDDEKVWERWRKWVAAIEDRPSVRDTLSEKEHYMPIYQRYAEDRAQSEMAKNTRSGRGGVP